MMSSNEREVKYDTFTINERTVTTTMLTLRILGTLRVGFLSSPPM